MRFWCLLLVVLMFGLSVSAREVQWQFKPVLGQADASPAIADLNGDGISDLVVTTTAGSVVAIDHEGRQIWMRGVQIPISIPPTAVNLVEDEIPEILAVNQSGQIFCMSGRTGDPIWNYSLPGSIEWGTTALATHDLDGDGALEIIAADNAGHVVCLSRDGEQRWQYDGDHGYGTCPAVGYVGGEKEPVIVFGGSKTALVCLDARGKRRWQVEGKHGASPVIADIDGDGKNEIISGLDNAIIVVDPNGKVRWTYEMPKVIDSAIAVGDANEDGVVDIYAIDLSGTLVCLAPDGTLQWSASIRERARRSPAIADVDGDGAVEVVAAGYSGELYVFTGSGDLKEMLPMPQGTNASPTIVDFAGDGTPTVVYVTATGGIMAYRWPDAGPDATVQWGEYRFNSARGGAFLPARAQSPVRITALDFGDLYAGTNTVSVTVDNPDGVELHIDIEIDRTGQKSSMTRTTSSDTTVDAQTDYLIDANAPSSIAVRCKVLEGALVVAHRSTEVYVVPFQKELNDLEGLVDSVIENIDALPDDNFALLGEVAAVQSRLPDYRSHAAVAGTLADVAQRELRDALRGEIARLRRLDVLTAAALQHHVNSGEGAGAWPVQITAANPWAPFGGLDEIMENRTGASQVLVSAFHGETESAAINAFNWSDRTKMVRVEMDDLTRDGAEATAALPWHTAITLHEVIDVPTQTLDTSADALPVMNQGQVLTLPAWEARQAWFTIDTDGLEPGTWKTTIHLRTLDVESVSFDIPLEIEVWQAKQADTNVLKHCNWGYVAGSRLKHHEAESIADRVAHGNNVFVSVHIPRATYDEAGNLTGVIDYAEHDEFVRKYAPNGMILFHNYNSISTSAPKDSEAYAKAYTHYVREWVKHLASLGVGYEDFAMYPIDEPGLSDGLVEAYLHNAKLTRAADPKVLMYTDPVARITEAEIREMLPYVDIWCPNRVGFLLDVGAEKLKIMRDSGAVLWNYECQGNAKHQSPLGYYRAQSWLAWHHDLTGIGFWSYCTSSADPWYRPQDTLDYLMTYQGDGVVTSKRWEAVRDGVEDFAMLYALRAAADRARTAGTHAVEIEGATALLDRQATVIARFCGIDPEGTEPGKGGMAAMRVLADRQWRALQDTRKEVAALLGRLPEP